MDYENLSREMGGVQNDLKKLIQNKIAPEKRSDFYLCDPDGIRTRDLPESPCLY